MTPATVEQFAGEHFKLNSISEDRQGRALVALARLEAFVPSELHLTTDNDLRAWMVSMLDDGLAPSSVACYLKTVMPYFNWCWRTRLISADDLMRLREVSPPRGYNKSVPRPYSHKELLQFWSDLDATWPRLSAKDEAYYVRRLRNGTSPVLRRLKRHAMRLQLDAIIGLALACGLRRNEIYELTIDDCHWDNEYVVVAHAKRENQNPKVRDVPYPDSTREAVEKWYRFRNHMGATSDRLWLSITGTEQASPMNFTRFAHVLQTFGDWQLHRLRHTCATMKLRSGMELEKLQRLLGHANAQQTLAYAQLARGDIHRANERIDADFQRLIHPVDYEKQEDAP